MPDHLPGFNDAQDADVVVYDFTPKQRVYVAKWWMRPICWILRRPTTVVR